MSVEQFPLREDYIQSLKAKANEHRDRAARLAAFFGTDTGPVIVCRNKAVGYQMLADVISADARVVSFKLEDVELL